MDESQLDNILVNQKNRLLELINDREFDCVLRILSLLLPLWQATGYGYKYDELLERIRKENV